MVDQFMSMNGQGIQDRNVNLACLQSQSHERDSERGKNDEITRNVLTSTISRTRHNATFPNSISPCHEIAICMSPDACTLMKSPMLISIVIFDLSNIHDAQNRIMTFFTSQPSGRLARNKETPTGI